MSYARPTLISQIVRKGRKVSINPRNEDEAAPVSVAGVSPEEELRAPFRSSAKDDEKEDRKNVVVKNHERSTSRTCVFGKLNRVQSRLHIFREFYRNWVAGLTWWNVDDACEVKFGKNTCFIIVLLTKLLDESTFLQRFTEILRFHIRVIFYFNNDKLKISEEKELHIGSYVNNLHILRY